MMALPPAVALCLSQQLPRTSATLLTVDLRPITLRRTAPKIHGCSHKTRCRESNTPWDEEREESTDSSGTSMEDQEPLLITAVQSLLSLLTRPTRIFRNTSSPMILGYPLALATVAFMTGSVPQTIVTTLLFASLTWLGRQVVLSSDDDPDIVEGYKVANNALDDIPSPILLDFLSLALSVFSAVLLIPEDLVGACSYCSRGLDVGLLVGLPITILAMIQLLTVLQVKDEEETTTLEESPQKSLMELWDRQFRQDLQSRDKNGDR
jgi:hypothetical protein